MVQDESNPYASPQTESRIAWPVPFHPGVPVIGTLAERGFLYRRLRLSGGLEAELEWNGMGLVETVHLNGVKVSSSTPLWYCPHFSFVLDTTSSRPQFDVDVRLSFFLPLLVRAFRLRIDDSVVYSEGEWR